MREPTIQELTRAILGKVLSARHKVNELETMARDLDGYNDDHLDYVVSLTRDIVEDSEQIEILVNRIQSPALEGWQ